MYIEHISLDLLEPRKVHWLQSYEMYGERKARTTSDLSDYGNYALFKAKCVICGQFSHPYTDSSEARHQHFLHCSVNHGYAFPEVYHVIFKVADSKLQDTIILSMLHDLPMPGYDFHDRCIKQIKEGKPVCVVHEGNEYSSSIWSM